MSWDSLRIKVFQNRKQEGSQDRTVGNQVLEEHLREKAEQHRLVIGIYCWDLLLFSLLFLSLFSLLFSLSIEIVKYQHKP